MLLGTSDSFTQPQAAWAGVFGGEEKLQGIGLKCTALGEVNAFPTSKLAPFLISEPEELS